MTRHHTCVMRRAAAEPRGRLRMGARADSGCHTVEAGGSSPVSRSAPVKARGLRIQRELAR